MNFELDNPKLIEQACSMFVSEMEPLYWLVEDAIQKGNNAHARSLFGILLYAAKYNPTLLAKGLRPAYRERLKQISFELYNDGGYKEQESIVVRSATQPRKLPFNKELELQEFLVDSQEVLTKALGDQIRIVGTEVDAGDDYRCDIVAESKTKFYPIELKMRQANHQVVSQCLKYCFYFYRTLRYNQYREIQGVVIANGFDQWSVNELRRGGIWCFDIMPGESGIDLIRL